MKCLMRMFAEQGKGVIFYETVISLKRQLHSYIECVPLPWDKFEDAPGYFKVCFLFCFFPFSPPNNADTAGIYSYIRS